MSWARGRSAVETLIQRGQLELVPPSTPVAVRLLHDAAAHIRLAGLGLEDDPAGALQLSYDASRKACAALLAVQGLRATSQGGHVAVLRAAREQFGGADGISAIDRVDRLRRRRHDSEYPSLTSPSVTVDDARQALQLAVAVVDAATTTLDSGRLSPFA